MNKVKLIEEYVDIAKKYVTIVNVPSGNESLKCGACGIAFEPGADIYHCSACHQIFPSYEMDESLPSDTYSLGIPKVNNENVENFKRTTAQFQNTHAVTIPDKIMNTIKDIIASYKSFDVTKMTKGDLVKIMKQAKIASVYYKHLNKIHFELTGVPSPCINEYIYNITRRVELISEIYEEIRGDRSNFIHGLYLLWIFLCNEGYKPDPDDFVLLKSRDVEMSNINTLTAGFKILRKTNPEFEWKIFEIS